MKRRVLNKPPIKPIESGLAKNRETFPWFTQNPLHYLSRIISNILFSFQRYPDDNLLYYKPQQWYPGLWSQWNGA